MGPTANFCSLSGCSRRGVQLSSFLCFSCEILAACLPLCPCRAQRAQVPIDELLEGPAAPEKLTGPQLLGVMDRLAACEATWHSGHSLAQTVATCFYILRLERYHHVLLCNAPEHCRPIAAINLPDQNAERPCATFPQDNRTPNPPRILLGCQGLQQLGPISHPRGDGVPGELPGCVCCRPTFCSSLPSFPSACKSPPWPVSAALQWNGWLASTRKQHVMSSRA